jgi:uncharacterized membrane protein YbhN (UPF0104 family)
VSATTTTGPPGPAATRRAALKALAGLAIGVAAAVAVAWHLGISRRALAADLRSVARGPLYLAAAGAIVLLALQALRWWLVMRPVVKLRYRAALQAMAVGFLANTILPARGGDLLRVHYLGRLSGVSRATVLATELVDFLSDKLGWLVAFALVCVLDHPPAWLYRALGPVCLLALVGVAVVAAMGSGLGRGPDGRSRGPRWVADLRRGFAVSQWKRLLAIELAVAPLPWLWESAVVSWAAPSLGLSLTVAQAFAVLTAFNVATLLPSPGNVGSFEAGGTLALTAFGVPHGAALTFALLYHLSQVVPTCALGVLVLAAHGEKVFGARGLLRLGAAPREAQPRARGLGPGARASAR